jgi:hypothetical protein|tara:strand:+ start:22878 stop:23123 length:246 start_codon:yes stop_codon:yes gene_type:complete
MVPRDKVKGNRPLKYLLLLAHLLFSSPLHASSVRSVVIAKSWSENDDCGVAMDPFAKWSKRPWPEFGKAELEDILRKKCAA